jgi:mRNA-degrading endonuclease toxin of MazEF toxin-antitoxin module
VAGSKVRPAAVALDSGDDDFVAAPITSRTRCADFDMTLVDWKAAGLNVPSVARIHKLSVLAKDGVVRVIGRMSSDDLARFGAMLCRAYCPQHSSVVPGGA